MKNDATCPVVTPEVLTNNYLDSTINRAKVQARQGLIQKTQVSKLLNRSRRTLHDWDKLLASLLDDWTRFKDSRQFSFYQYYCLEKISRYQTREQPFKSLADIASYVERNINNFTLETYLNQF